MKVLVVGGAGYIGSAVAAALIAAGHRVVVFDNLSHGHRQAVPDDAPLILGDMGDAKAIDEVFRRHRIEAVIHLAALMEVGESMTSPERYFRNNVAGTLTLLETMLRNEVPRLVFSSTAAIYADPDGNPVAEDARLAPASPYGESKLQVERMLGWFHRAHGLRYACLRYFNVAGAIGPDRGEDHRPESHLIPMALKVALGQQDTLPIYGADYPTGDGTCVRDYTHVADVAQAHLLALDALGRHEQLHYNLGSGKGFSVREVIATARRVTGHAIPVIEQPRRAGDPASLVASSTKIGAELGWMPKFTELEPIIASAWEWHRRHPNGYVD